MSAFGHFAHKVSGLNRTPSTLARKRRSILIETSGNEQSLSHDRHKLPEDKPDAGKREKVRFADEQPSSSFRPSHRRVVSFVEDPSASSRFRLGLSRSGSNRASIISLQPDPLDDEKTTSDSGDSETGIFIPLGEKEQMGASSVLAQLDSPVPAVSGRVRSDFRPGQIIIAPCYHTSFNPNLDLERERNNMVNTKDGWVYIKKRPMVVLWLHHDDCFAVPMYTHSGRGLAGLPQNKKYEYVGVYDKRDYQYITEGLHDPIEIERSSIAMRQTSALWLAGGHKISYQEKVSIVGHISADALHKLTQLWLMVANRSIREAQECIAELDFSDDSFDSFSSDGSFHRRNNRKSWRSENRNSWRPDHRDSWKPEEDSYAHHQSRDDVPEARKAWRAKRTKTWSGQEDYRAGLPY